MSDNTVNVNEIVIQPDTKKYLKEIAVWTMVISVIFSILTFFTVKIYMWPTVELLLKIEFRMMYVIPLLPLLFYLVNVYSVSHLFLSSFRLNKALRDENGFIMVKALKSTKIHLIFFSISILLLVLYGLVLFIYVVFLNPLAA